MRVLLIEDDLMIGKSLKQALQNESMVVDWTRSGVEGEEALTTNEYSAVLLDLNLPDKNGIDVLRSTRQAGNKAPILVITARDDIDDRISGLDLGADDYMTKPFDVDELEARVRMLLRRRVGLKATTVSVGDVTFDLNARSFSAGGAPIDLPARERTLLETLFLRSGKVVPKQAIIESLAGFDDDLSANAIEQYVSRLRKRLAPHGLTVRTARGIGYYLERSKPAE